MRWQKDSFMCDWVDFSRWPECKEMERPGIVFEVVNGEDLRMLTQCVVPLDLPFDWKSAPVKFRPVPEPRPRHSTPLPRPADRE